jgi:predicted nucleic-acid-binding Zn-ribbon protein
MPYTGDKKREYDRIWVQNHRKTVNKYSKNLRNRTLIFLGGKCVKCGCTDLDALEINHIDGGGSKDKYAKGRRKQYYLDILSGRRKSDDLNIMCKVCNAWHCLVILRKLEDKWVITYSP